MNILYGAATIGLFLPFVVILAFGLVIKLIFKIVLKTKETVECIFDR